MQEERKYRLYSIFYGDTQAAQVFFINGMSLLFWFPHFRQRVKAPRSCLRSSRLCSKSDTMGAAVVLLTSPLHLLCSTPPLSSPRSWKAAELDLTCPPRCSERIQGATWPSPLLSSVWGSLYSRRSSFRPSWSPSVSCISTKSWTR